ncbi:unnamed protein product [Ectocarpus sp. 12 AP-2014]
MKLVNTQGKKATRSRFLPRLLRKRWHVSAGDVRDGVHLAAAATCRTVPFFSCLLFHAPGCFWSLPPTFSLFVAASLSFSFVVLCVCAWVIKGSAYWRSM